MSTARGQCGIVDPTEVSSREIQIYAAMKR